MALEESAIIYTEKVRAVLCTVASANSNGNRSGKHYFAGSSTFSLVIRRHWTRFRKQPLNKNQVIQWTRRCCEFVVDCVFREGLGGGG